MLLTIAVFPFRTNFFEATSKLLIPLKHENTPYSAIASMTSYSAGFLTVFSSPYASEYSRCILP